MSSLLFPHVVVILFGIELELFFFVYSLLSFWIHIFRFSNGELTYFFISFSYSMGNLYILRETCSIEKFFFLFLFNRERFWGWLRLFSYGVTEWKVFIYRFGVMEHIEIEDIATDKISYIHFIYTLVFVWNIRFWFIIHRLLSTSR